MKNRKIALLIFLVVTGFLFFYFRETSIEFLERIASLRENSPFLVALILIGTQVVLTPLAFPGLPLTLLIGGLFGPYLGTLLATIGNVLGSTVAFLVSRYILRDWFRVKFIRKYPKIQKYEKRLEENGLSTVLVLRLIPIFPYNGVNLFLGVTSLKLKDYIIGSAIGMIPGTFLFVALGGSIRNLNPINITLSILGIIGLTYLGRWYDSKTKKTKK